MGAESKLDALREAKNDGQSPDAVNQREWDNPANWRGWGYSSRLDNRLWVPKRFGIVQALNFAHPGARVFVAGMCIVPLALLFVVIVAQLTK